MITDQENRIHITKFKTLISIFYNLQMSIKSNSLAVLTIYRIVQQQYLVHLTSIAKSLVFVYFYKRGSFGLSNNLGMFLKKCCIIFRLCRDAGLPCVVQQFHIIMSCVCIYNCHLSTIQSENYLGVLSQPYFHYLQHFQVAKKLMKGLGPNGT